MLRKYVVFKTAIKICTNKFNFLCYCEDLRSFSKNMYIAVNNVFVNVF